MRSNASIRKCRENLYNRRLHFYHRQLFFIQCFQKKKTFVKMRFVSEIYHNDNNHTNRNKKEKNNKTIVNNSNNSKKKMNESITNMNNI